MYPFARENDFSAIILLSKLILFLFKHFLKFAWNRKTHNATLKDLLKLLNFSMFIKLKSTLLLQSTL